jgi:hypothetical protein
VSLSSCSEPIELLMTIQIGARQKYLTYCDERTRLGSEAMDVTVLTGGTSSTLEGPDSSEQHFREGGCRAQMFVVERLLRS